MQLGILWYVFAGFVLGFTVSTLWEWLYYRGQRLRWRADATVPSGSNTFDNAVGVASWREPEIDRADTLRSASEALPWETPTYRSSGVFLESEKEPAVQTTPSPTQFKTETFATQPSSPPIAADGIPPAQRDEQIVAARKPTYAPVERARISASSDEFAAAIATVTSPTQTIASAESAIPVDTQMSTVTPVPATVDCDAPPIPAPEQQSTPLVPPPALKREPAPTSATPTTNSALTRSNGYPDDLTKIQGIGDAYGHRLYAANIYTWQQVANSEVETLRSITKAKPNARPDEWKVQAQELATKFNRLDATYEGPVPDDLSRIDGIGPTYADTLYRAGICTYEQLGAATPAELAFILPTPAIGNEFNFASWVKQATKLAYAKQKNVNLLR